MKKTNHVMMLAFLFLSCSKSDKKSSDPREQDAQGESSFSSAFSQESVLNQESSLENESQESSSLESSSVTYEKDLKMEELCVSFKNEFEISFSLYSGGGNGIEESYIQNENIDLELKEKCFNYFSNIGKVKEQEIAQNSSKESSSQVSSQVSSQASSQTVQKSFCPEIILPKVEGEERWVGDGTANSCTEQSLQLALDKGGKIKFNCGENPHTILISHELSVNKMDQWIEIDGNHKITLDGQNKTRILKLGQKSHAIIKGMKWKRGSVKGIDLKNSGGAIYGGLRAKLYVVENEFFENSALAEGEGEVGGGALYNRGGIGAETYVIKSKFYKNKGNIGGAINNLLTNLYVIDSIFTENSAVGTSAHGGAIYTDGGASDGGDNLGKNNGKISICGSSFIKNTGYGQGGGAFIYVYGNKSKSQTDTIEVKYSLFKENQNLGKGDGQHHGLGGGLRIGNGTTTISHTEFIQNFSGSQGGGLWIGEKSPVNMENILWKDNIAGDAQKGGLGGAAVLGEGDIQIKKSTAENNKATAFAGAFAVSPEATIEDSKIWNNSAGNQWGIKQSCDKIFKYAKNVQVSPLSKDVNDNHCVQNVEGSSSSSKSSEGVSVFKEAKSFSCQDSEDSLKTKSIPFINISHKNIYFGYRQVTSNNKNPIATLFDNGKRVWCVENYEVNNDDGEILGAWFNGESLYMAFSSTGTQGTVEEGYRRFTTKGWLTSYGAGGGPKISTVAEIDLKDGKPLLGSFLKAQKNDGKANSLIVKEIKVLNDKIEIYSNSWYSPLSKEKKPLTCEGSSPFSSKHVFSKDFSQVLEVRALNCK